MIDRNSKKSESEIDNLIRTQLGQAGFNEKGKAIEDESIDKKIQDRSQAIQRESDAVPKKEKVIDNRYLRIEELPSNFHPYPGRTHIMVRPFSVQELKLIARSIEHNNVDYITQAIDNCIDMDVYQLTIADYFYLYYWFRIESYPNTPHYMEWTCDEPVKDEKGEVVGTCGHENMSQLKKSDIKIIHLDDLNFDLSSLDDRLDFPRVKLLEDLTEANSDKVSYDKSGSDDKNTFKLDDLILVDAAKWLKEGTTIFDKLKFLEQQPSLELYEIANKANKALQFGVYEYTLVSCGRCGAKRRYKVLLDAPRFFPFID